MSEQEIRTLKNEMVALTKSVNEAIEIAKKSAEVAYNASKNNNIAVADTKRSIEELKETLKPIADIYVTTKGFGKITKYIFIILSFIVALIISIKTLLPNLRIW